MATQPDRISVEEYLKREEKALDRHEYLNGEIFVMAGGSPAHATIGTNVIIALGSQLANSTCTVRGSDMRIRTGPNSLYSYADVVVSCVEERFESNILLNPVLIVEVLSDSTEAYDRGKKFELYRQVESFVEYIIIAQDRQFIEQHVRDGESWIMWVYQESSAVIKLKSVPAVLRAGDVYSKVF